MQQTERYHLNLIDKTDAFSPDPINDNTEKLEAALIAAQDEAAQALDGVNDALNQRVTSLEFHRIVTGKVSPDTDYTNLGFTPVAIFGHGSNGFAFAIQGYTSYNGFKITGGGFTHTTYLANCFYVALR